MTPEFMKFMEAFCIERWGSAPAAPEPIPADGSDRKFFRFRGEQEGESVIALVYPEGIETGENDAYAAIGRHLHERGVSVPEIFAYQRKEGFIVMEDAGGTSLYDKVIAAKDPHEIVALYEGAWDLLIRLQRDGSDGFQKDWCFQGAFYDRKVMLERESGYFLDVFLSRYLGEKFDKAALQKEFELLADEASKIPPGFLMHRDFQSRNLFYRGSKGPYVLDFQAARFGPAQYDVAAMTIDPYVSLGNEIRERILDAYLSRLKESGLMSVDAFLAGYPIIALHRNLQILGAYSFLGYGKKKPFFLQWIPGAIASLNDLLESRPEWKCPVLRSCVERILEKVE